jgi:Outer membrane protein and related peptidoglycan-associated (lipo)proteins
VGCDDLLSGEEARVQILASAILPDNQLVIDGFASEEGPADFNEELSCARAKALASALIGAGISSNQIDGIYMHGATPGGRADRRSAVPRPTRRGTRRSSLSYLLRISGCRGLVRKGPTLGAPLLTGRHGLSTLDRLPGNYSLFVMLKHNHLEGLK